MESKILVIAEAGVNHNGSLTNALKLVDVAVSAGADIVKFQTFKTESVVSKNAEMAEYQKVNVGKSGSQYDMIRQLELSDVDHEKIAEHCLKAGIEFMSTPFDVRSLDFLHSKMKVKKLKISSGEIVNAELLYKASKTGLPIILSTGMSTLGEIEDALAILAFGYISTNEKPTLSNFRRFFASGIARQVLKEKITLLHCTTAYPTPFEEVNLRAMETLGITFGLPVGFSDHTPGISIPTAAAALGAKVIEKHFTLDKNLPGPDHKASLDPAELHAMVKSIREVELAMGNSFKSPTTSEFKNKTVARRSLVAAKNIMAGEIFSEENLTSKRPEGGISPLEFWDLIGEKSSRDFKVDEMIHR